MSISNGMWSRDMLIHGSVVHFDVFICLFFEHGGHKIQKWFFGWNYVIGPLFVKRTYIASNGDFFKATV